MSERALLGWADSAAELPVRRPLRSDDATAINAAQTALGAAGRDGGELAEPATPFDGVLLCVRFGALALALCLAVLRGGAEAEAPWLGALALPEALIRGRRLSSMQLCVVGIWWSCAASVGVLFTGAEQSPLLPCLPVAAFTAGLGGGVYASILANGLASAFLVSAQIFPGRATPVTSHYFAAMSQWMVLNVAVGLIASWVARLSASRELEHQARYAEVYGLLEQLRSATSKLPGSLDLTTTCEVLLDACRRQSGADKGAVLIGTDGEYLVPTAVIGTRRVPWRGPLAGPGPLRAAWESGRAVVDVRRPDVDGKRAGSVLLVVPLSGHDGILGLLALEARTLDAFTPRVVRKVVETVQASILGVETARLFEEVRGAVTFDERTRLAREMHDGVAQDLAYLGFELDALRTKAARVDSRLGEEAANLRGHVTSIIADIRSAITDLKSSGSVERGLGSAIASYVRNVGATGRMSVHLSLRENAFRLPTETEVLVFRILQELTAVARDHANAKNLWVSLFVDAPALQLTVEHDGDGAIALKDPQGAAARLAAVGGLLDIHARSPRGTVARIAIGGWLS